VVSFSRHSRSDGALPPPEAAIHPESRAIRHPGLLSLGWALLCIGAVAFGGLGATLPLLRRELAERRGWLRPDDITEGLAYTKPLPGSTVVQVVTFLGWRLGNWPGAIVATVAFVLPALALSDCWRRRSGKRLILRVWELIGVVDCGEPRDSP
jgi:Chromate transporter